MSPFNLPPQAREDREQIKRELEDIRACLDRIENLCRSIIYPIRWRHVASSRVLVLTVPHVSPCRGSVVNGRVSAASSAPSAVQSPRSGSEVTAAGAPWSLFTPQGRRLSAPPPALHPAAPPAPRPRPLRRVRQQGPRPHPLPLHQDPRPRPLQDPRPRHQQAGGCGADR